MTHLGPSHDTLQTVLPVLLDFVAPEGLPAFIRALCALVCKAWRRELEARGFCNKTVALCSALAEGGDVERLWQNVQLRLDARTGDIDRAMCRDASAFLEKLQPEKVLPTEWWKTPLARWEGSLCDWLQAASQEPDASFLSRGAASTAQVLGLPLVQWVTKPQGGSLNLDTLASHRTDSQRSVDLSPDGTRIVTGSSNKLLTIWNARTGAKVIIVVKVR